MQDGKPNGAVVVFRNIATRKKIEQQREDAYEKIKALTEQLEQERDYLRDEVNITVNFGEIIGKSDALKRALAQIEAVARTSASVLILGESGVGKEMIARAIHTKSDRAEKPLEKQRATVRKLKSTYPVLVRASKRASNMAEEFGKIFFIGLAVLPMEKR